MNTPRPQPSVGSHPRDGRPRVHRHRRAGGVGGRRSPRRARRVVGHRPQRPGAARGAGLRPPAAHLGRPRADRPGYRFYVDLLLEHRRPPATPVVVAASARRPTTEPLARRRCWPACLARGVAGVASRRLRALAGDRATSACDRSSSSRSAARASWSSTSPRRPGHAEGRGRRRDAHARGTAAGGRLPEPRVRRAAARRGARGDRRAAAGSARPLRRADGARLRPGRAARSTARRPSTRSYVDGAASLLADAAQQHAELSLDTLRALLEMIEEKQRLVRLLNEYIDGPGLTVVIGAEHSLPDLRPFSLVAASYLDGRRRRQRRRHRPDAHALLARHRRRRQRGAGRGRRARRTIEPSARRGLEHGR